MLHLISKLCGLTLGMNYSYFDTGLEEVKFLSFYHELPLKAMVKIQHNRIQDRMIYDHAKKCIMKKSGMSYRYCMLLYSETSHWKLKEFLHLVFL